MQTRLFAANWKMHLGPDAAADYLRRFLEVVPPAAGRDLWFFPPAVSIESASSGFLSRRQRAILGKRTAIPERWRDDF